jgi:hypothetical protein
MGHRLSTAVLVLVLGATPAAAQSIGTFKWQLLPYCNVLTLTVIQMGGIYTLSGTDDQCGAQSGRASAAGTAFLNPGGTIGMGLAIVTTPGGRPVHVDATINLGSLSGTWRDSEGHTSSYIYTPLAGIAGPPRPTPTGAIAPGSITSVEIAAGAVGAVHLAPGAVTAAAIADGSITGEKIADGTITAVKIGDRPRAGFVAGDQDLPITTSGVVVRSLVLTAPAAGKVVVTASGTFGALSAFQEIVRCSLTTGQSVDATHVMTYSEISNAYNDVPFALTRGFDVTAGVFTVNLYCIQDTSNTVHVRDSSMTAQYFPVP